MYELRKWIETLLPEWIQNSTGRRMLYCLFWATTAFMAWAFIVTNPVFGWFVALAPVLLVWRTSARGLGNVSSLLFGATIVLALVPAFFLGMAQKTEDTPTGLVFVGLLIFVVWVAAFPTMVGHVDRQHRRRLHGAGPRVRLDSEPFAEFRLLLLRLWMAAVVMLVIDETLAAVVCALALVYRGKVTAVVAGLACLLFPLLSVEFGTIVWDAGLVEVVGAVLSGYQWLAAVRNPYWGGGLILRRVRYAG